MDRHPHQDPHTLHETDSDSLSISSKDFHSRLSDTINQLFSDNSSFIVKNHDSNCGRVIKTISLSCFPQFLNLFKTMDTMFSDLVSELDYPISKWDDVVIDEYLSYTLNLLHLLNSISSSLSHLSSSRLTLVHALSLIESGPSSAVKKLKPIAGGRKSQDNCELKGREEEEERAVCGGKGKVVFEAVKEMKSAGSWVYGVLLCGLELEGGENVIFPQPKRGLGLGVGEGGVELKEVREVNEAVGAVVGYLMTGKDHGGGGGGEEGSVQLLKRKLEEFEKLVEEAENKVNCLFSEVLASRNRVLDCIRIKD